MQSRIDEWRDVQRFRLWRACVMAVVVTGHLVVLHAVLQVAAARPSQSAQVMLVRLDLPSTSAVRLQPAVPRPLSAKTRRRRSGVKPTTHVASALSVDSQTPPRSPLSTVTAGRTTETAPGYVAGGGALSGTPFGARVARLPGGLFAASSPRFPMTDVHEQGMAGIVKLIRDTAGGIDRHCLDFDVWRGLTPTELAARHVTTAAMDKAADEHGCRLLSPSVARGTDGAFGAKPIPRGEP